MSARHVGARLALIASALHGCRGAAKDPDRTPVGSAVTEAAPQVITPPTMREDLVAFPAGKARGRTLSCGTADPHDSSASHPPDTENDIAAFAIDRRPVSCEDYGTCIIAGACPEAGSLEGCEGEGRVQVRSKHAVAYCAWRGARLPTYLEWQRAVRGVAGNIYPHGDTPDPARDCVHPTEQSLLAGAGIGCEQVSGDGVTYFTESAVMNEWTGDVACGSGGRSGVAAVLLMKRLDEPSLSGDVGQFRCARTPK